MSIDRVNGFRVQLPTEPGIRAFQPPRVEPDVAAPASAPAVAEGSFGKAVGEAVEMVNSKQMDAEAKIASFVRGDDIPLHDVVLAQEEAEISFRLMLEVRDKLLQAYQDVMRTPL